MVSLSDILPPVSAPVWDRESEDRRRRHQQQQQQQQALVTASRAAPPYGHRKGWIPRSQEDFGDGGAFPECHVAQYPLGMGKGGDSGGGGGGGGGSGGSSSNALAVQLDDKGKVKYDVIARQGHAKDKIVYSKLTDLLPSAITSEDDPELQRPSMEEIEENTEKTRQALEKLTQGKISSAMPVRCAEKQAPAQYIRYTPSQQGVSFNSGATQRVIRMVEQPKDPMEPPKFKINKKVPRGPPSPPAPVMHSPTRKVTVKEQQEWRIPPCVSNWKNAKGYTIPLDKRLAADGRGLQSVHINENFAKLAEALYIADRKAREQVEMRAQIEKKLQAKEQVRKEENLKELAKKAREENAGLRPAAAGPVDEAEREREKLRQDRSRDRKRESAIANSAADKRGKLTSRERDVTEQIALGLPQKTSGGGEAQFDQRLFNNQRGMDTGFGDDESYNVYDRPWRENSNLGSNLYRPTRSAENEYGADLETLMSTNRFVPDRGFSGADAGASRSGPVEFQRSGAGDEKEEDDLFGVIGLLTEAKKASKRNADGEDRGRDDRDKRRKRD
ncbi:puff-specific protein Bx42-like isoform X2 [Penaeus chinensis]|uniref:puff-specific protein Bx42-like isoform X2 n=1 Tax=Penaeus chinensis TaxID=139456 RepID=UPI001FB6B71B|nr:puff-specific protein Bx42-like isoform X2 [Penaeus chinensis]